MKTKEFPNGIKITKYLLKIQKEMDEYVRGDQRLDFFNKLRYEDNEYYIDSDPYSFMKMYHTVETCVSPGGENEGNLLRFLLSPYVYIAYDKKQRSRILIILNEKDKEVFLNPIYGEYDTMFLYSIINFFKQEGYKFLQWIEDRFNDDMHFYKDRSYTEYDYLIKLFDGTLADSERDRKGYYLEPKENRTGTKLHLYDRPNWVTFEGDAVSLGLLCPEEYTTVAGLYVGYYCDSCDRSVYEEDYDFEQECCHDCAEVYCEVCSEYHPQADYDWDYDACYMCAAEIEKSEQEEKEKKEKEWFDA